MRCSSVLAVSLAGLCFIASSVFQSHRASAASEFTAGQKTDIEKIIHDYLLSKPEVLKEAIDELDKKRLKPCHVRKPSMKTPTRFLTHKIKRSSAILLATSRSLSFLIIIAAIVNEPSPLWQSSSKMTQSYALS